MYYFMLTWLFRYVAALKSTGFACWKACHEKSYRRGRKYMALLGVKQNLPQEKKCGTSLVYPSSDKVSIYHLWCSWYFLRVFFTPRKKMDVNDFSLRLGLKFPPPFATCSKKFAPRKNGKYAKHIKNNFRHFSLTSVAPTAGHPIWCLRMIPPTHLINYEIS